jgi:hypothetical protein
VICTKFLAQNDIPEGKTAAALTDRQRDRLAGELKRQQGSSRSATAGQEPVDHQLRAGCAFSSDGASLAVTPRLCEERMRRPRRLCGQRTFLLPTVS